MKKFLKCLIIIFCSNFVFGYTWNDVEKDYSELLNKNIECNYVAPSQDAKAIFNINSIKYNFENNGFTVKYDGGVSKWLLRKDNKDYDGMETTDNSGNLHYYDGFNYPTFFSYIKSSSDNSCQKEIFLCKDGNDTYVRTDNNNTGYLPQMSCYAYQYKSSSTTGSKPSQSGSDNKNCYNVNAQSCNHYTDRDINDRYLYIEIGKESNGVDYFAISYDDFKNATLSKGLNHVTTIYNDEYYIYDDGVFENNGEYLDKIYLRYNVVQGSVKYYIASKDDKSTGGDLSLDEYNENKDKNDKNKNPVNENLNNLFTTENPRLNYSSLCSNDGIRQAVKIIGYVVSICKWVVPFIIIVLGMIDFSKAVIANDEKAISKATSSLIKRFIAGVIVILLPTIIMAILNFIKVTKGIEDNEFGACTTCLFSPSKCGSGMGTGGGGTAGGGSGRK